MSGIKYNSFDVFDTLIGRICYKGVAIFDIMESITGIKNFGKIRRDCETSNIDETYGRISKVVKANIDELKTLELKLEHEFSFPIWKYINDVSTSDIMISDMYLSEPQIRALIHKHAHLDNKLIVTSGGKASGAIWANRDITCNISKHIGDNRISDYVNPRQRGINAELITNVDFNKIENLLSEISYELACIMRAIRLTRQHDTSFFNNIAIHTMMPICALICLNIYLFVKKDSYQHIVFLSRDGYWFHKMFQILFPAIPCSYVYFSRLLMSNPEQRDKFISNMNTISGKKLFIDLHGTGTTFNRIINRLDNATLLLCFSWTNFYPAKPNNLLLLSSKDSWLGKYIEDMFLHPMDQLMR